MIWSQRDDKTSPTLVGFLYLIEIFGWNLTAIGYGWLPAGYLSGLVIGENPVSTLTISPPFGRITRC
jgi:hypothetical protein